MKCNKVQTLLSDLHNGELTPRAERSLNEHLAECVACQHVSAAYGEMMEMLASTEPPELPEEFEASLHMRLAMENATARQVESGSSFGWLRALKGAGLMLAGAAAVVAFFTLRGEPASESLGMCPETPAVAAADQARVPGADAVAAADQKMRVGEVAFLTLTVESSAEARAAELEVVLPDGLALVGEDYQIIKEKTLTWTTTLAKHEQHIRIPVRAERPGMWQLVARVRVGDTQFMSEAKLHVTRV